MSSVSVLVWQWRSCLLPSVHRHPERQRRISVHGDSDSLDSKYQSAGRHQTGRHQMTDALFPKAKGFTRLTARGVKPPSGFALGYGQAVRCSLNGQAMLAYEPDLRFLCRNRTSSAHRAGWFRGEYLCCLRQRPLWWLAPPPFPTGKRLTRFSGR